MLILLNIKIVSKYNVNKYDGTSTEFKRIRIKIFNKLRINYLCE
jgi:hypothetical protein